MADDILKEAREAFELIAERESENRKEALDDLRFARLAEQWPEKVRRQREREGRPCLTINRLPSFIRQVVNDARQNSPAIKVHPADSNADPQTAEIYNGLIRNIEVTSRADVAYPDQQQQLRNQALGLIPLQQTTTGTGTQKSNVSFNDIVNGIAKVGSMLTGGGGG